MNTRAAFLQLLRCLLAERAGGLVVSVTDEDGKVLVSARLPAGALEVPTTPAPKPLTECQQDVLAAIEDADRRLTTPEVFAALTAAGRLHGDSTVIHALADLSKRKHLLTNATDTRGKGYGLAAWE